SRGHPLQGAKRNLQHTIKSDGEKMKLIEICTRRTASAFTTAAFTFLLGTTLPAVAQHYNRVDLTSDQGVVAPAVTDDSSPINYDPNLLNSWGLARSSNSAWWIADNHAGVSTLYDGNGVPQQLVVSIAPPKDATGSAAPTGVVFNATTSFQVAPNQ